MILYCSSDLIPSLLRQNIFVPLNINYCQMGKNYLLLITVILFVFAFPGTSCGINTKDTRMLSQPAISAGHIAFIYAEDLWIANTDGSDPKRLTVDEGVESDPCFSCLLYTSDAADE